MAERAWVALLRGINVGRNKRIAMADLRVLLQGLGYGDVRTLLQSGNAFFSAAQGKAADHERAISGAIKSTLGLEVPVLVRSGPEIAAVAAANPFVARRLDTKELSVAFLSKAPAAEKLQALAAADYGPDEFEVGERALYLRQPNGVMGTKLPDLDRALGVIATARNWNTVGKLVALSAG